MQFTLTDLANSIARYAEPTYVVDGEGTVVSWNVSAERVFGLPRRQVLGNPCHRVIRGKDDFGKAICCEECFVLRNARDGSPLRRFRMHVRIKEGHHVETKCATVCIRNSRGEMLVLHSLRLWPDRSDRASKPSQHDNPGGVEAHPAQSLTPRQKEVLSLLAAGDTTQEIAAALDISPGTVRSHIEGVLAKLGAHSRLEAVVLASRAGLI